MRVANEVKDYLPLYNKEHIFEPHDNNPNYTMWIGISKRTSEISRVEEKWSNAVQSNCNSCINYAQFKDDQYKSDLHQDHTTIGWDE